MKNKGFTLVELLATVIILGLLAMIAVPAVMDNIEKARADSYKQIINNIEQTAQLYVRNNKENIEGINVAGNTIIITIQDLVNNEDLDTPIIDPVTDKEIALDTKISVFVKPNNKYSITIGDIHYVGE